MAVPTLTYSKLNGARKVSINGGALMNSERLVAPPGTHDIKTVNGISTIRKGNGFYEPLDVATALGKF